MNQFQTKKVTLAGLLAAIAVIGGLFSFPIFNARAAPIQHMVNLICAVFLGPWYGLTVAFIASLLRNIFGIGTLLAFPGSMIGAFLSGYVYQKTRKIFLASIAEIIGTGILGGLSAWPFAVLFLGETVGNLTFYIYIFPFLLSTIIGTLIASSGITILKRNGIIKKIEESEFNND